MNESTPGQRGALVRESLIFQLKLMADGFRDLVLVPVSLIATLAGLVRGGKEPAREFRQVIELGRQTEKWINLFGNHDPLPEGGQAASLDQLLSRAEHVLREQAREGGLSESASRAIQRALQAAQAGARQTPDALPERDKDI
jgi:hypothetical protein